MKKLLLALMLLSSPVSAANIGVLDQQVGGFPVIYIDGEIVPSDWQRFDEVVAPVQTRAIVAMASDGGNLAAGIHIAEIVHNRSFATFVPSGQQCASVCGIIWLAGAPRLIAPKGSVGFHAAYNGQTGEQKGDVNAVVGAFLSKLGLGYEAIVYVTHAGPDEIAWLSKEDADRLGIVYRIVDDTHPKPFVDENAQAKLTPPTATLPEDTAVLAVRRFLAFWSGNSSAPLDAVVHFYGTGTLIDYFGKPATHEWIKTDIENNAKRWPYRRYSVFNNDISATCGPPGSTKGNITPPGSDYAACEVRAMIEWHVANGKRKVGGLTQAYYGLVVPTASPYLESFIQAQSENVINRHPD